MKGTAALSLLLLMFIAFALNVFLIGMHCFQESTAVVLLPHINEEEELQMWDC